MKTFKIIGITGPAQCGKDTVADHIINKRPAYRKTSFADPMKEMLSTGLGLTSAQLYGDLKDVIDIRYGCAPRHMLQTLGTEWGRDLIDSNVWVNAMESYLADIGGTFVIPDIRFENEADLVRRYGRLIHVRGRDNNIKETNHISEAGINTGSGDLIICNIEGLELLYGSTDEALHVIEREENI